ncbi:universal stress protein [Natronolimnobius baerhuensis]|uniref:Universal stress protein UspA n=1 Tax=Natronolimnobius baerhuensis TaxID=253108 RepID=A0A202E435_9EURY|nr:universal stress protein [Natronolimnobius baerhuensis]OVE83053.1 universal stress protein UspA [Natronolimnobius baerhuensis]
MADRVLVPYDGSPLADEALEFTLERFPDAAITALYVIEIPAQHVSLLDGPELQLPVTDRARSYATMILEEAIELAAAHDREIATTLEAGKPEHRIVARVSDDAFDLIVMGSHGRDGLSRLLLGSVAEAVVRRAPVPVVVVR